MAFQIPISAVKQVRRVQDAAVRFRQWVEENTPPAEDVFDFAQYVADNKVKLDKGKRPEQNADGSYAHPPEFPQEYCTLLERTWVLSDMMNSATKGGKANQMSTYEVAHIKVLKELLQAILRTNDILTAAVSYLPWAPVYPANQLRSITFSLPLTSLHNLSKRAFFDSSIKIESSSKPRWCSGSRLGT
jgi:hypothetical protein